MVAILAGISPVPSPDVVYAHRVDQKIIG
jgi:hypothetical protein